MFVPDPGLVAKLDQLLSSTQNAEVYQNCKVFCEDGFFSFNSLFLFSTSDLLKSLECIREGNDGDLMIILPSYSINTVQHTFDKLFVSQVNSFHQTELDLLKVLGIQFQVSLELEANEPRETELKEIDNNEESNETISEDIADDIEEESLLSTNKKRSLGEENLPKKHKKFRCSKCSLRLTDDEKLEHVKLNPSHTSSCKLISNLECKLCSKSFKSEDTSDYRSHIASHRNEDGMFSCSQCNKKIEKWGHFIQHMYKHRDSWKKPFKCQFCDYTSINRSNILKHENGQHLNPSERKYNCAICDKSFKTLNNLSQHIASHKNKIFSCEFCTKQFRSNIGLKQHRRLHTGETLSCEVCQESFLSLHAVKRHERVVHAFNRITSKFFCNVQDCSAQYSTVMERDSHQRDCTDKANAQTENQEIQKEFKSTSNHKKSTPILQQTVHSRRGSSLLRPQLMKENLES
eukprot:TRINITY_DN3593_c0_g1_i2.p1 TRINITY_DN3593_c0_g1~~TRINITY_DN3593_c0_g1_i2.p1  ORF type:complete len:461 (-),score=18.15 TRINITY_DN3593_c0_g1_i2:122-1504(-)